MRYIRTLSLGFVLFATAAAAQGPYGPHPQFRANHFGVAGDPRAVVAADFNNDGKMDFATANIRSLNPASVSIALWTGSASSGLFAVTRIELPAGPIALTAMDLNHDGAKDLAVVSADAAVITILLNDGDGAFAVQSQIATASQPRDIVDGDFNRDGRQDLAFAAFGCDCVQIFLQAANGEFVSRGSTPAGADPWGLATADFDRDGILDLVVTGSASHTASVLYGNGGGDFGLVGERDGQPFSDRVDTRVGRSPRAVAVGDFNRDGRLDFVTANVSTSDLSLTQVTATGDRSFAPPLRLYIGNTVRDVETVDVNGDGKLDLLLPDSGRGILWIVRGKEDGFCASPPTGGQCGVPMTGAFSAEGAREVAFGDFNRDGRVDPAVANQSGTVTIFFNETAFVGR